MKIYLIDTKHGFYSAKISDELQKRIKTFIKYKIVYLLDMEQFYFLNSILDEDFKSKLKLFENKYFVVGTMFWFFFLKKKISE